MVSEKETGISIDQDNLGDYVGKPVYSSEKMYETTPAGVAMGLAWTSHGGSSLYIETLGQKPGEPNQVYLSYRSFYLFYERNYFYCRSIYLPTDLLLLLYKPLFNN